MGFRVREIQIPIVFLSFTNVCGTASYLIYLSPFSFILSKRKMKFSCNPGLFWWINVKKKNPHKSFSTKQTQHLNGSYESYLSQWYPGDSQEQWMGECYYFYFEICLWKVSFPADSNWPFYASLSHSKAATASCVRLIAVPWMFCSSHLRALIQASLASLCLDYPFFLSSLWNLV